MSGSGFDSAASSFDTRFGTRSATPAHSSSAFISLSSADVATTRSRPRSCRYSSSNRAPGVGRSHGSCWVNSSFFRAAMARPSGEPSSRPAMAGSSLSAPMPMSGRTVMMPAVIPCSRSARIHDVAWAALLSISVPSMSNSTDSKGRCTIMTARRLLTLVELVHPPGEALHVGFDHQVANCLRRDGLRHLEMRGDVLQELQHRGHLALRQQIDLQIEVSPLVGLPAEAVLAGQNEQGQEDRLERDRHRQERERKRVERPHIGDAEVEHDPEREPRDVKREHGAAREDARDPIAELLGPWSGPRAAPAPRP